MKKQYFLYFCLSFLCIPARFVSSFDEDSFHQHTLTPSVFTRGVEQTAVHRFIGSSETLLSNGIMMGFNIANNKFTGNASWAIPTADSISRNLSTPWHWEDTDGFKVNQIGHPIQGAIYFGAGRLNGFSFYESVFFSALGSSSWEIMGESNPASINDLITTVTGSLSLGEILYRLYLEACAAGVPQLLALFINPMAGFHRLATGWEPPDSGGNIYEFNVHLGTSYAQTHSSISSGNEELFSFRGPVADLGLAVIYGNPFDQGSRIPFNHFEFDLSLGMDMGNYMGLKLITDAYLFSFSPVYTYSDMMSTGLSLHLDFVSLGKFDFDGTSTIDQFSNALDWTIKYQHLFPQNVSFQTKFHFGFTFMGVSEYYSPDLMRDLRNYGAGLNSKLIINLEHKRVGKLSMGIFGYTLWSYPGTSALSGGTVNWLFTDIAYSHYITNYLSVGISHSFALERGLFSGDNIPNTRKSNNAAKLFLTWNF